MVDLLTAREFTSCGVIVKRFRPAVNFQVAALLARRKASTVVEKEFVEGFHRYIARFQKETS